MFFNNILINKFSIFLPNADAVIVVSFVMEHEKNIYSTVTIRLP